MKRALNNVREKNKRERPIIGHGNASGKGDREKAIKGKVQHIFK